MARLRSTATNTTTPTTPMIDGLDSFLVRAGLAGVGVALAAGPLGCFVVWRRIAYFGDATAHAAILGVALALGFSVSVFAGALVVSLAMSLAVLRLSRRDYSGDATLGVLSYSGLAAGLVVVSLAGVQRASLDAYLFGDILAVGRGDLAIIWGGAALATGLLCWRWRGLLTATLNPDLAAAAGYDPKREELVFMLALAVVVAVAIKVVGALLIGALLLIPASTARPFAATPERMAALAAVIGAGAALGGLWLAWEADTPGGPSIVVVAALLFLLSTLKRGTG